MLDILGKGFKYESKEEDLNMLVEEVEVDPLENLEEGIFIFR